MPAGFSLLEVACSRKIVYGFQGIFDSRAKADMGFVMLGGSRKIVCRYAGIRTGCSEDHHELILISRRYFLKPARIFPSSFISRRNFFA